MKKWLPSLLLLLLFVADAVFADSSNPSISSVAVSGKTDLSIAYLSSVFGTISGVLVGTSGQMLGKLLGKFNEGILVTAGCWLAFSVGSMVFKSATTGSFMQQDNKVPMILLRVALGFGLLIPNPSTGYTLLQGIVMQVTVQGIKLADQVWEYGLDYMSNGGALWSRPVQQGTDLNGKGTEIMSDSDLIAILGDKNKTDVAITTDTLSSPNNYGSLSVVQKIMAMEACMVKASIDLTDANHDATPLSIYENTDNYSFQFPSGSDSVQSSALGCGVVFWNSLAGKPNMACTGTNSDGTPNTDTAENSACAFSHLALSEIVSDLLPAVKKYVCLTVENADQSSVCSGVETSTDTTYMTDAMMGAVLNYKNLIDPILRQDALNNSLQPNPMGFASKAKKDGWMVAGRYYWDLLRAEDAYDIVVSNSASYSKYIPDDKSWTSPSNLAPSDALGLATQLMVATTGNDGYIETVNKDISAFNGAASAGNAVATPQPRMMGGALKLIMMLLGPVLGDLVGLLMTFSTYAGTYGLGADPVLWLHKLGLSCLSFGVNIWTGLLMAVLPIYMVGFLCSGQSPVGKALEGTIDMLKPVLFAIAAGFVMVGISLGFYMPLYPYMLFTFGVIGWIIAVIEAMVAAPIIALGITHPEGHDFLGRATQGMMLLVALFLRPVLMLLGLFAAMILCHVSLSIIVYTFSGFSADIFYFIAPITGHPSTGDPIIRAAGTVMGNVLLEGRGTGLSILLVPLIVFPLFLGIFTMLVYTTTVTCYSLIHQLPDYGVAWIGGPQHHGANPQTMTDQVKQGISGMAGKLGEGMSHVKKAPKKEKPATISATGAPTT